MTPPKVSRTKTDPSAGLPSPNEEELSPIARMRAAAEQSEKLHQSRANAHRAVEYSRDALDALDDQREQQQQQQQANLGSSFSRDALDALDEQQGRNVGAIRSEFAQPAWARDPHTKSSSDRDFDAAAQRYLSSATSPLVRSVSSRPESLGTSRSPKWQTSPTSSPRNDRNSFRAPSPSRSFEDPYIDQSKAVTDAFAGVDISFGESGQKDEDDESTAWANKYGERSPGHGGGLTEDLKNKFDALHGSSNSRYAQSDVGAGRFYAYDDTTAKSPLDIFYERRASASPTKTPAALQKMKARFGPNYSASGEALEISPRSNNREVSETTSDFFPSMELEKDRGDSRYEAEMDAVLREFDQRPPLAPRHHEKVDKSYKQTGRSSKRFLPKRLFRNPRAAKSDF